MPAEVQVVAERYCRKKSRTQVGMRGQKRVVIKPLFSFISVLTYFHQNEDIPLDMCTTHCKQICPDDFHTAGKERALAEISSLYEYVQKMPDGPQKAHFLKRVSIPQSSLWAYCLVRSMMQNVSSLPNWGSLVLTTVWDWQQDSGNSCGLRQTVKISSEQGTVSNLLASLTPILS